jgi:hypothetical protein
MTVTFHQHRPISIVFLAPSQKDSLMPAKAVQVHLVFVRCRNSDLHSDSSWSQRYNFYQGTRFGADLFPGKIRAGTPNAVAPAGTLVMTVA